MSSESSLLASPFAAPALFAAAAAAAVLRADAARRPAAAASSVRNWSGNQRHEFSRVHRPATLAAVQAAVRGAARVKAAGSLHSFNSSAGPCGEGSELILLSALAAASPPELDAAAKPAPTLTVSAGATYGEVFRFLAATPFALHNSASLPHISVGGSVATATHGSGARNGNLSTGVVALELVTADGEVLRVSRASHGAAFDGFVVHLGALGVVTRVTLALVPAFRLRQDCFENLPMERVLGAMGGSGGGSGVGGGDALARVMAAGYSVSLFTTWRGPVFEQVWRKSLPAELAPECAGGDGERGAAPEEFFGAVRARAKLHPCGVPPEPCTEQLGAVGAWHERLPHFLFEFQPSVGEELQSEFFVSRDDAPAALRAVFALRAEISPILYITEVRSIARDSLWMSPEFERDSVAIHFTWKFEETKVAAVVPKIEAALAPFAARPHWGKLFSVPAAELERRYPRLAEFRALRRSLDPSGKFLNSYLRACGVE